jgi:NAD+ diphosphatase
VSPSTSNEDELDRAAHLRTRGTERETLADGALLLPMWRSKNLIDRRSARPAFFGGEAAEALRRQATALVFLGLREGCAVYAVDLPVDADVAQQPVLKERGDFGDLRLLGASLGRQDVELCAYARGMLSWHKRQQHCGKCGANTDSIDGGHVRLCTSCGERHFPRTDPAIMALVIHEGRCLVARQPSFPPGMYSILAGFVEPGETLEGAVMREVREEAGLEVVEPRYHRSQPWPFPSSLMIGFSVRAIDDALHVDGDELEEARWLTRAELDNPAGFFVPPVFSLAGQLLAKFRAGDIG